MNDWRIVLASQSPRRAEIMQRLGLDFIVRPSLFDESIVSAPTPQEFSALAARGKALDVANALAAENQRRRLVIAADTVVHIDGRLLLKPRDPAEAREMLQRLQGRVHRVTTGLALAPSPDECVSAHETAEVRFHPMTPNQIRDYVETGEPLDKAGAYGIQGIGASYIAAVNGDFFNVMGLPIHLLKKLLQQTINLHLPALPQPPDPFR
ncbi:septum formation protein Maf [Candidatus Sumerlaeota bacterium]|nr:septum formation protein Maf [Candidatus Sumerlaeota bacterium]